jgi:TonB family protein
MRRQLPRLLFTVLPTLTAMVFAVQSVLAQASLAQKASQTGVVLLKLAPPIYPPLARQARITGDVRLQLLIRRDGSVESAEVVSGHPMLKQGALESARKSTFECKNCQKDTSPYLLTYTFAIRDDDNHYCGVEIDKEWHVRSFKCIYLWK